MSDPFSHALEEQRRRVAAGKHPITDHPIDVYLEQAIGKCDDDEIPRLRWELRLWEEASHDTEGRTLAMSRIRERLTELGAQP